MLYILNQANQRVSSAYPKDVSAGYLYDDAGRLTGVSDGLSNTTTYSYDDGSLGTGRLEQIDYPGVATDSSPSGIPENTAIINELNEELKKRKEFYKTS